MAGPTIFFLVLVGAVGAVRRVELRLSRPPPARAGRGRGARRAARAGVPRRWSLCTPGILVASVLETFLLRALSAAASAIPEDGHAGGAGERPALLGDRDAGCALERAPVVPVDGPGAVTSGPYRLAATPTTLPSSSSWPRCRSFTAPIDRRCWRAPCTPRLAPPRVRREESVLMADESYRLAFKRKPDSSSPFSGAARRPPARRCRNRRRGTGAGATLGVAARARGSGRRALSRSSELQLPPRRACADRREQRTGGPCSRFRSSVPRPRTPAHCPARAHVDGLRLTGVLALATTWPRRGRSTCWPTSARRVSRLVGVDTFAPSRARRKVR